MFSANLILIFAAVLFYQALATQMSSCSNSKGIYPNVTYSINSYVCESSPCICTLGCASIINANFKAPRYLEKMKPKIHASCMGVELDYPLDQDDACEGFTNTQCPIVKNEIISYNYSLTVPAIFPEVTVTLRFLILDEVLNEDIICFEWDIKVQKDDCPS